MPDTPREPPLRIVLDTGRYVVVDKPSGLLSVPGIGPEKADCVRSRVAAMYPRASGPMTVHRLDQDTSGLIVVGLDADAQRAMSQVFEHRRVTKRYIAVVEGHVASHAGLIDLPLRVDWPNRPRHIVAEDGRPSQTRYRVLGYQGPDTRVEFTPITGRGHQLRVHAADERGLGAPILGDPLYGDTTKAPRLLLHAWSLEFADPFTGQLRHVVSEPAFP
ncbi:MAG: RluA family pseudouridine synthase [Phycisphaeraceae bacterium]|nr:RluA family pseudouridine synthase [Phycisphaeraceae bacterium]